MNQYSETIEWADTEMKKHGLRAAPKANQPMILVIQHPDDFEAEAYVDLRELWALPDDEARARFMLNRLEANKDMARLNSICTMGNINLTLLKI